jgi:transcription antitermination factor NusA-like protein
MDKKSINSPFISYINGRFKELPKHIGILEFLLIINTVLSDISYNALVDYVDNQFIVTGGGAALLDRRASLFQIQKQFTKQLLPKLISPIEEAIQEGSIIQFTIDRILSRNIVGHTKSKVECSLMDTDYNTYEVFDIGVQVLARVSKIIVTINKRMLQLERKSHAFLIGCLDIHLGFDHLEDIVQQVYRDPGNRSLILINQVNKIPHLVASYKANLAEIITELQGEKVTFCEYSKDPITRVKNYYNSLKINVGARYNQDKTIIELSAENGGMLIGRAGSIIRMASRIADIPLKVLFNEEEGQPIIY